MAGRLNGRYEDSNDFELNDRGRVVEQQQQYGVRNQPSRRHRTHRQYYDSGRNNSYQMNEYGSQTDLIEHQTKMLPELPTSRGPVMQNLTKSHGYDMTRGATAAGVGDGHHYTHTIGSISTVNDMVAGAGGGGSYSRALSYNSYGKYPETDDRLVTEDVADSGRFKRKFQITKKVWWTKRHPWFVWLVSTIQVCVFIAELAKMGELTGSPIQTQPSFNPMVGPSSYVMINMGARFTPCMHPIPGLTDVPNVVFPCPNSTDISTDVCSLAQLCGFGGFSQPKNPHQWWRFIIPMFLHAGFIHIGFNLLLQLRLGADLEKQIGTLRFVIVYLSSGIAGFVLGGNFTPDGIASTGASGSLFGVIALDLLDLLFNWPIYQHPKRILALLIAEIIVSFVIGLLPGLDNFSHIGGFAMGLLTGTAILRSPLKIRQNSTSSNALRQAKTGIAGVSDQEILLNYGSDEENDENNKAPKLRWSDMGVQQFVGRSKWWYTWLGVRIVCLGLAVAYFAGLVTNFYSGDTHCSWCKYLSCLPVHGWCDQGQLNVT